ncbi:hypothetical protein Rwratislav_01372 [Rhodococcus wratislaviensis IFP 2016]|nr:hypothetical protein Rwratislav_01372 [Rhodococcus wratislaviensis IFP 2016]
MQDSPAATTSPAAPTTKSGGATRTSTTEAATGDSVERAVDKTGWYGGFKITVDDVTATPEGGTTTVDLELSYENLVGVKNTAPDTGYLEVDGGEVVEVTFGNPDIAGFGKGTGTATASLKRTDESADLEETLDSLVLVYGEPDSNTTRLPFAADAAVESLEPRGIPVGQTFSDKVQIELSKAFLWPSYQAGEQNKYELWTELSLTCTEECARFGYGVTIANFTLTAPNGKSIKADDRSPWATSSMSDISPVDHQWLVFVIDEPATGNYTFNLTMKAMSNQPEYAVDATTTIAL